MSDIYEIHARKMDKIFKNNQENLADRRFLALALCGEAGELANYVKKEWRDEVAHNEAIAKEIADVRIYLEYLARAYGINVDEAVEAKFAEVEKKYGI